MFDPKTELTRLLRHALSSVEPGAGDTPILLERPRDPSHGDFATNLAMQLARFLRKNPRELAMRLLAELPYSSFVQKAEVAGAGFINFTLEPSAKAEVVPAVLLAGGRYGASLLGGMKKVLLEFVSANPTGPLHVGHGRGAAYGASLASLLSFAGWDVTREYYVNDAGRQMDILTVSTWLRYLEFFNTDIGFPPNAYQGDYVRAMAKRLCAAQGDRYIRTPPDILEGLPKASTAGHGDNHDDEAKAYREQYLDALIGNAKKLLGEDWNILHQYVLTEQLSDGRNDLEEFGVHFDIWFSEKALFDLGMVARCVGQLEKSGHLYEQDGAKWFKSTAFGDEKDRVVQRENGLFTYFASDIAYHMNKYERGFDRLINIWGADHHGYIPRVKGAVQALSLNPDQCDVALVQFAVLYRDGQKISMSTRTGEFVTLRELREEVGNDACRFFYVLRKADQHLDFDLDLAKSQSNENPVYYIQYAYARISSVLAQWGGTIPEVLENVSLAALETPHEQALITRLAMFPEVVESAAADLAPHQIAFYLKDLASEFHAWYNDQRILVEDERLMRARLALAFAVRQVIANGMGIIGVFCPENM